MKTVAIIGAGPSGLVAAKTLLHSKRCQYDVRVFEKSAEVGGLWAVHKDRPYDGMLNPEMPTNLSRFNIGFSDLSWNGVGLEGHVPYWPRAWQVGQYIRAYVKKYLPNDVFSLNTTVTFADMEPSEDDRPKWKVRWKSTEDPSQPETEQLFDHLILATGLFSASSMPTFDNVESAAVKVVHSTKLRRIEDVAPDDPHVAGTIIVVGGGMSGGDASTVLANQLSDAVHSPTSDGHRFANLKLVQLCPAPAYALPLAASVDSEYPVAPDFLPLDLAMYDLSKRPEGPIELKIGKPPPEVIGTVHKAFTRLVGSQADLNAPGLEYTDKTQAPYVTLTEQYSAFVRSGNIEIVAGRLTDLVPSGSTGAQAIVATRHGSTTIDGVVGMVYATGFTPQPAIACLGPRVRQALNHDPSHNRLPIILDEHATLTHSVPGFAVIGYHEGAFWGSMEMESRLVEHRWSTVAQANGGAYGNEENHTSVRDKLTDLRMAMTNRDHDVPQYWMGDYVGLMETISRQIHLRRNDFDWDARTGPVTIYRYVDDSNGVAEAEEPLGEYLSILKRSKSDGLFAARAAFLSLQGRWNIHRTINSALDTMPSGDLTGTAFFHPRAPTDADYDFEYLYAERGSFRMSNGMTMQASRQYAYRYQESTDQISVWFVKADGKTVDYMYHGLKFDVKSRKAGWLARADHLCIADMYKSDYCFQFQGANVAAFDVVHAVKGPKKNYVSETKYTR